MVRSWYTERLDHRLEKLEASYVRENFKSSLVEIIKEL